MLKQISIILALVLIVALPFALRPKQEIRRRTDDTLVIISPHNEAIRHEFTRAFEHWYREKTGRTVEIDWRLIGGTSEITRFLEGEYAAVFQNHWVNRLGKPWSNEVQQGFAAARLSADAPALAKEARAVFLASEVGCGIDLSFGGGTYDFIRHAQAGRLIDAGVVIAHPEWFTDAVIPRTFAGEEYWDKEGRWIGTVLSAYGIIYNRDALKRLGIEQAPRRWEDLQDPRYLGQIALADPAKSGSIAKAFENVIQQQMQKRLIALQHEEPGLTPALREERAVREGWVEGLRLLQRVGANTRYFTDSAQKVPIDVAAGDCAAGMCIDFYGRQQEETVRRRSSHGRVGYVSPEGGSVSSVDPIGLLRGAPHREVAVAFIEFVLSMDGQRLWNLKPGTSGGPARYALRRTPVRRDFFTPEVAQLRSDPEELPYGAHERLIYRAVWTGRLFRELSFVIRVMCLDTQPELRRAWEAILAAGMPADALAVMQDLSAVDYAAASGILKTALSSKNKIDELRLANELSNRFRLQYLKAEELAKKSRR